MEHNEYILKEFQEILAKNGYSDHFDQDSSNKVRVHMKQLYEIPKIEALWMDFSASLCQSSPELGSSEDVGYEDWVI